MSDARSHVGATGLMQLMPATAKETARRFGIPLASTQQVLNPHTNIQLGTAYLSQIYGQFNGNRVLASAAYNAGPGRVRQWLRNAEHLSFDVWVENIPFDETRQYTNASSSRNERSGLRCNAAQACYSNTSSGMPTASSPQPSAIRFCPKKTPPGPLR